VHLKRTQDLSELLDKAGVKSVRKKAALAALRENFVSTEMLMTCITDEVYNDRLSPFTP
jgi:hypothetical protein